MLKRKKRYEVLFWLEIVEPLGEKRKSKEPKDLKNHRAFKSSLLKRHLTKKLKEKDSEKEQIQRVLSENRRQQAPPPPHQAVPSGGMSSLLTHSWIQVPILPN